MRLGGMVIKRYIDVESQTMFGENVCLVFGERETWPRPGTGVGELVGIY
jgi:hypothetical protein